MKYGKRHAESELIKANAEIAELNEKKLLKKGANQERERIIKLLEKYEIFGVDPVTRLMLDEVALIARINSELGVCSCDPCNDRECDCYGKRCEACKSQD